MSDHDPDLLRNAEETRRLGDLVARLDAADLARSLGGGWTVAFALAHLAFWDARQDAALRVHARGEPFPPEDEVTNAALELIAGSFGPEAVAAAAVEAAARLDATAIDLTAETAHRAARGGAGVRVPPLAPPRGAHRTDRGRTGLSSLS